MPRAHMRGSRGDAARGPEDVPSFVELRPLLLTSERRRVAAMSLVRSTDYLAGRSAAQLVLTLLDRRAQAIPAGRVGGPIWPEGVVGS